MVNALEEIGHRGRDGHHEVAIGQHEIDFEYADALRTADNAVTFKTTLKAIAATKGLYATFMPKPFFGINGSGMHTHQSPVGRQEGQERVQRPEGRLRPVDDRAAASSPARSSTRAGMIAVLAPLVNSYKRLVPGYEAPVYVGWARINRSALIRIPQISKGQLQLGRIELRCPDPSCNPYLAFAVMLAAGLDGDRAQADAAGAGRGEPLPLRRRQARVAARSRSCRARCARRSTSWRRDEVIRDALGDHVFERFVEAKTEEWDEYRMQVCGLGGRPLPRGVLAIGTG